MEAQGASVVTFPQSMRFQPVAAHAGVGDQPDLELRGGLHALGDDRRDTLLLRAEHVDHQFVVHLQDHPRADAFGGETPVNVDHGDLHNVGRRTLNRGVHGVALGKAAGDSLMSDELWSIEELELPAEVTTLNDLTRFAGLQSLTIHDAASGLDLSLIGQLTTLRKLDLAGCTMSQSLLEQIGTLPDLTELTLSGCAIDSINPLVGLTKLEKLDLSNNAISDIMPLSSMTELRELHLTNNPVGSISYLNNCLLLEKLYIENCGISRLSGIADNTSLQELYASNNSIQDISMLAGCTAMKVMDLSDNQIADISVIANFPELINFKANNNKITGIPKLDPETSVLVQFSANYNEIEDVSGLSNLIYLNYVRVDYNKVKDISCLKDCYSLIQIDAWDNPLDTEKIPELQDIGIIVNYNSTYEPPEETTEE